MKIKVSYQNEEELQALLKLLGNRATKVKKSKAEKENYKKAYITCEMC